MSESGTACPVCDGTRHTVYSERLRHRVVRCRSCGLFFVDPVPDDHTYHRAVADSLLFTYDQLVKREFFRRRAAALLDEVHPLVGTGALLDVGCGIGTELEVARDRGWEPVGIELAESSIDVARKNGLTILTDPLGRAQLDDGRFSLVTVNHALEHIPNARAALTEVHRVLRPRGILFVAVPNVNAWKRFLLGDRYGWTFNDDHYLHFSVATLRRILTRTGFEVLGIRSHRCADFQKKPVDGYPVPFRWLNRAVERAGLGIELFAFARKPDAASGASHVAAA
jgi:2-polyprenyl-3-methyl-5-hydroxy-6-metoxy-1,4-benzoquinol methylase